MTSIERTAYPRFSNRQQYRKTELQECYSLSEQELKFINQHARTARNRLNLALQLKVVQNMGGFFEPDELPGAIVKHLRSALGIHGPLKSRYDHRSLKSQHRSLVREFLQLVKWELKPTVKSTVTPLRFAINIAYQTSEIMNYPADIINVVIEKMIQGGYELPPFSTLDRLVRHVRNLVNQKLFKMIEEKLHRFGITQKFEQLLITPETYNRTGYNALKKLPKRPTINNFKELLTHHDWLMKLGNMDLMTDGVAKIKLSQFAEQAKSIDASDLRQMSTHTRYGLMAALLLHAQQEIKDALAATYCKTLQKIHSHAEQELEELRAKNTENVHRLANFLFNITNTVTELQSNPLELTEQLTEEYARQGGVEKVALQCQQVMAENSKNHLPFLWKYYKPKRPTLFKLLKTLQLKPSTQEQALENAMAVLLENADRRAEVVQLKEPIDLSFASEVWRKLIFDNGDSQKLNRRFFEMCIFTYISFELKSGDLFVSGADSFGDYRRDLLPWTECLPLLNDYCRQVGLPTDASSLVHSLKQQLTESASKVDERYPDISDLVIGDDGVPVLKRRIKRNPKATTLSKAVKDRMPERNLLDVLCNTHQYTEWAHVFGPLSGAEPKLPNALERYIINTFGMGTAMGPAQTARHVRADVTPHMLSWINRRHVNVKSLNEATFKLINYSNQFSITQALGSNKRCAADGTLRNIYENNLFAETHYRYRSKGGIAYHHVSDNYIALFSTFIPCGVWEAIAIIEGLLQNKSDIQPDTVHADTQGQSAPVFCLAYLFGIKLMPRIRNWKDLTLFRPDELVKYEHIDDLFGKAIQWDLIETHWQDLMQVAISIQQGKISSQTLLRKLGNYSRKNRLYLAFRELGRVVRTIYLLEYISDLGLRESITESTNKVEAYNGLSDWATFGDSVIVGSNDDEEMEKAVKYNMVITNSIILQNFIDMSSIIVDLQQEGWQITKEDIAKLSPYLTEHIKRFGDYAVNLNKIPQIPDSIRVVALH